MPDAAAVTALGLHALQHRGQEATGIVSFDGARFHSPSRPGPGRRQFRRRQGDRQRCPAASPIGHNRYATTGDTILRNVQPLYADFEFGGFAVAHNGNLTNAHVLRRALVRRGCLFQSTTDSEVFVHLIAISLYSTVVDRLIDALKQVVGAYSLVALSNEALMGVRDPLGVRPLILGRIGTEGTGGWVLASETCALDIVGADFVRDVEPGEIVVINDQGVHSIKPFGRTRERFCVFEYIYFARPDSVMEGTPVYEARKRIGAELARESRRAGRRGRAGAGFRRAGGDGLRGGKRHPVRARDHPQPLCRPHLHRADRPHPPPRREAEALAPTGRCWQASGSILVDDSHRARHHQPQDRRDGARRPGRSEVHMRISSPPTTHSCFYGIDTPERGKLLAARHDVEEMAELIGADSLAFISIDGLYRALGKPGRDPARAALLRRLLHRRLPDPAARSGGQRRPAAEPAGREPADDAAAATGCVALVTGASRGIGAAAAVELARLGAHVVITARTQGGLEETDDAIRAAGGSATLLPLDLHEGGAARRDRPEPLPALRPAGHAGAQRRRARPADAGRAYPAATTGPTWSAVNLTRGLAADPHLRSAAARSSRRPRGVRHRRAGAGAEGLLGRLRRDQGGDGASGADLGGRGQPHARAGQPVRPRPGRHPAAPRRDARRDPGALPTPADVAPALAALCLPAETRHGALVTR